MITFIFTGLNASDKTPLISGREETDSVEAINFDSESNF